jgi:Raf kinase inhibitor-like YbhB/YbcL family protein
LAAGLALVLAPAGDDSMAFSLTSTAFKDGAPIPSKHTCDGADRSPPLAWSDAPPGTAAFALIAEDPDAPAGTWVHWVAYNLPATTAELPENVAKVESLDLGGARQGRNDFHRPGYGGPCPPPGPPHRYFFKLYALDAPLQVRPGATKKDVEAAMQGHTLGMAQLSGTYARPKR